MKYDKIKKYEYWKGKEKYSLFAEDMILYSEELEKN